MKKRGYRACFFLIFWLLPVAGWAKQEVVPLTSRHDLPGGANITLSYLLDMPEGGHPGSILLVIPGGNGLIHLQTRDGKIRHDAQSNLFIRNTKPFQERRIGVAMPDVPSDRSKGINVIFRKGREHADDLRAVLKDLKTRYRKSKIFFATSGSGGVSALFAAGHVGGDLDGVILAGADTSQLHAYDHSAVKTPVLMMHHAMDSCDPSPMIEAKEIAGRYSFTLIPFSGGASDQDSDPCGFRTRHGLFGLDGKAVAAIDDWIAGRAAAMRGPEEEKSYLNERVVMIPTRVFGVEIQLQTTVYKPDGPGPFPLAIISHGVPFAKVLESEIQARSRFCLQSAEFVKRGFVVAVPMRRGYGKSGGQKNVDTVNIATFGLEDAKNIQATIEFMGKESYVDGKRIVLVGQSGGGLASLAHGSLGNPEVKGIVNFAGGLRVNSMPMWEMRMADAFGSYAKTTRIPSLWFYAENDSYFSPTTVRAAYDQYQAAGGRARLLALPPFKKDGHNLFHDHSGRSVWVGEVDKFLSQIGLKTPSGEMK
jgi:dienelactone hydrolase